MAVKKLTKADVERPELPKGPHHEIWDSAKGYGGFGIRVSARGRVSFIVRYWSKPAKRERWVTLGSADSMNLTEARAAAKPYLTESTAGGDLVAQQREDERRAKAEQEANAANSVATLAARWFDYLPKHVTAKGRRISPKTVEQYTDVMRLHVLPVIGGKPVVEVTKGDVRTLHERATKKRTRVDAKGRKRQSGGDYVANRAVSALSAFYGWLQDIEAVPEGFNPARKPPRNPEQERGEYADVRLSHDQEARLVRAIYKLIDGTLELTDKRGHTRKHSDPIGGTSILALLDTGRRSGEILALTWERLDLENGVAILGATKGKKAGDTCYLSERVREAIKGLPRIVGNPYVFTGHGEGGRRRGLQSAWELVKGEAGLTEISPDLAGFHLHDLRHHRISELLGRGVAPQLIIRQVGHADYEQLKRYGHVQVGDVAAVLSKLEPVGPAADTDVVKMGASA